MGDDHLIRLPQLGLTMTEGMLVEWMVAPGESVSTGDILYIVETDKIANEIPADRDGVLESIFVQVDETVPVGATLGVWAGGPKSEPVLEHASEPSDSAPHDTSTSPAARIDRVAARSERIVATPYARKLAREHGIELSNVIGGGPKGRIIAQNILTALETDPDLSAPIEGQPLRGVQRVIAARMLQSQREIPHFYLTADAEISELLWLHDGLKQKPGLGRITLTHWIATAVGLVIAQTPRYRTVYRDECHFVLPGSDVGIAVAIEDGLYAPVARDLGAHGLAENAVQIDGLIGQARDNTLSVDALSGGAITVSNLGGFNVRQVFPLIIPGQSSILGVGRQQSVFRPDADDAPILKRELALVLACDHRVFNGTHGARMLQAIVELLEDPLLIIAQARK